MQVKEAGNSLADRIHHVAQAWERLHTEEYGGYVLDVFDDSVVVKTGNWRQPDAERKCYRIPYTMNADNTVAFAEMSQWQEVTLDYVTVNNETEVAESYRGYIEESASGNREAIIIVEGDNASGQRHYTEQALQTGVAVFEGAKMYVDHPTMSEATERPERSVRDLVGVVENVHVGTTKDGRKALKGTPRLASNAGWLKTLVDEGIAGALSIHAHGKGKHSNGKFVVEAFAASPMTSVDFVTVAGAGGEYVRESAAPAFADLTADTLRQHRPDLVDALQESESTTTQVVELRESEDSSMELQQQIEQLKRERDAALKEAADLRSQLRTQDAERVLNEALGEGLPEQTVARLRLMAQPAIAKFTESADTTEAQLSESLTALVKQEREYIASIGGGHVTLPMTEAIKTDSDAQSALAEALGSLLGSQESGKIAANGRK